MKFEEVLSSIPNIKNLESNNFFLIAGPCAVESEEICMQTAEKLVRITNKFSIPYIFKASYKKANRSRLDSFTGIGDKKALTILSKVKKYFDVPILTDIHSVDEANLAAEYVDVLQIPAFLCRQTDLIVAAARTNKVINIKKGQFLSPGAMKFAAQKAIDSENKKIILTDRGTMFGYSDIIVDYRGLIEMQQFGLPVVLDITHSLQKPNQASGITGGKPLLIETIARAGIAVGIDGIFAETHPDPQSALSDGENMIPLNDFENLLKVLTTLRNAINSL